MEVNESTGVWILRVRDEIIRYKMKLFQFQMQQEDKMRSDRVRHQG